MKASSLAAIPTVLPSISTNANFIDPSTDTEKPVVKFFGDGDFFDGTRYWQQLQEADKHHPIKIDRYGNGGAVEELQKKFESITGKEQAIYMPTGTMANQFAISVLSGENTKVYVQDTSHVYRDEADAAQSVFNKRLMPLARNKTYFTAAELKSAIDDLGNEEVFKSGIGCVSVENPVRRTDGRMIPIEEIKKISEYCRTNNIKLHLDGARIYMASAWSGVSVKEYSSYFDTVYISLYKYFGASGGAILCGNKEVISKMPHLIKIHGGNMFGNWLCAAIALHRLEGMEERLQQSIIASKKIFSELNKIAGLKITELDGGTNIYKIQYPEKINIQKFGEQMGKLNILLSRPTQTGEGRLTVNETILYKSVDSIVNSFNDALKFASA